MCRCSANTHHRELLEVLLQLRRLVLAQQVVVIGQWALRAAWAARRRVVTQARRGLRARSWTSVCIGLLQLYKQWYITNTIIDITAVLLQVQNVTFLAKLLRLVMILLRP